MPTLSSLFELLVPPHLPKMPSPAVPCCHIPATVTVECPFPSLDASHRQFQCPIAPYLALPSVGSQLDSFVEHLTPLQDLVSLSPKGRPIWTERHLLLLHRQWMEMSALDLERQSQLPTCRQWSSWKGAVMSSRWWWWSGTKQRHESGKKVMRAEMPLLMAYRRKAKIRPKLQFCDAFASLATCNE